VTRRRDLLEAGANTVFGLGVSWLLIAALRAASLWDAPAPLVSAAFVVASLARGYVLRRVFRRLK